MLNYDNLGLSRDSGMSESAFNDLLLSPSAPSTKSSRRLRWRRIMSSLASLLSVLLFVALLVAIPVLTYFGIRDKNTDNSHIAFYSSAAFVLLTLPVSVRTIAQHVS